MAAPTFESSSITGSGTIGSSSTLTISSVAPTASSNRVLLVGYCFEAGDTANGQLASVTYNGESLTQLYESSDTSGWELFNEVWYLLDADFPGSSGDIVATCESGSTSGVGQLAYVLYSGAGQNTADWDYATDQPDLQDLAGTVTSTISGDFAVLGLAGSGTDTSFTGSSSDFTSVTERHDRQQNFSHTFAVYTAEGSGTGSQVLDMDAAASPSFNGAVWSVVLLPEPSAATAVSVIQSYYSRRRG